MDHLALFFPAHPAPGIDAWCARYDQIHVDLGTGDAAFALRLARQRPDLGVIGVDTCLDHVRVNRRRQPSNLALLRCDAAALPAALDRRVSLITVNFPFGSLLTGLIDGEERLIARLAAVLSPEGAIELRLNESALATAGATLRDGERSLLAVCRRLGCGTIHLQQLDAAALRRFPSSWAKRIGAGRDTLAIEAIGRRPASAERASAPAGMPGIQPVRTARDARTMRSGVASR